jgi:hypothetical protein
MIWIVTILGRLGVAESLRRPLGYLTLAVLAFALLGALWAILASRERADDKANQAIGATAVRSQAATRTIQQAEKANAAAETVRRNSDAARDECLRNARNPANC